MKAGEAGCCGDADALLGWDGAKEDVGAGWGWGEGRAAGLPRGESRRRVREGVPAVDGGERERSPMHVGRAVVGNRSHSRQAGERAHPLRTSADERGTRFLCNGVQLRHRCSISCATPAGADHSYIRYSDDQESRRVHSVMEPHVNILYPS